MTLNAALLIVVAVAFFALLAQMEGWIARGRKWLNPRVGVFGRDLRDAFAPCRKFIKRGANWQTRSQPNGPDRSCLRAGDDWRAIAFDKNRRWM